MKAFLGILTLLLLPALGHAQSRSIILEQQVELAFHPERVVFIISYGTDAKVVRRWSGVQILLENKREIENPFKKAWIVAAVGELPNSVTQLEYDLIIAGKANQYELITDRKKSLGSKDIYTENPEESIQLISILKADIAERRGVLNSTRARLERLREEAEVIGNFAAIRELRVERQRVEAEVLAVRSFNRSLEELIQSIRFAKAPTAFQRREAELTQHLAELAQVVKGVERGVGKR